MPCRSWEYQLSHAWKSANHRISRLFSAIRIDEAHRFTDLRTARNLPSKRGMPSVLEVGPYKFIFFSSDRDEPVHIHVKRDRQIAKFWLKPVSLAKNKGFRQHELDRVAGLVVEYEVILVEAWHDYFDS